MPRIALVLKSVGPHAPARARRAHEATVREVERACARLGAEVVLRTAAGATYQIPPRLDLVVTVGGDGTLLLASHRVGPGCPVLGINSAPEFSVGFLCGGTKGNVLTILDDALHARLAASELTRMRVDRGARCLTRRVLNDALFSHASPAATSRYVMRVTQADGRTDEEYQRSSGVWIGPAAGSTAAQHSAGGRVLPLTSRLLQYVVREPYVLPQPRVRMVKGLLREGARLSLRSEMTDARLFIDGPHVVFEIAPREQLTMRHSNEPLLLLGVKGKRQS